MLPKISESCTLRQKSVHFSHRMGRNWTEEEDNLLRKLIVQYGKQWSVLATHIPNRSATQIAARWDKCINPNLQKGPFSAEEDQLIIEFVEKHGIHAWPKVTSVLPKRTAKQCRERWFNNLDPTVTKGPWTPEEDDMIYQAWLKYGPKWSQIAKLIPGRTDNSIKNRWNASISKRMRVDENGEHYLAPGKIRKHSKRSRPPPIQVSSPTVSSPIGGSSSDECTDLGQVGAMTLVVTPGTISPLSGMNFGYPFDYDSFGEMSGCPEIPFFSPVPDSFPLMSPVGGPNSFI